MPSTDASGRQLSDTALRVLEAVATNDGEATASEIVAAVGDQGDEGTVRGLLDELVRSGHLAGSLRGGGSNTGYGLLPAGRAALRLR